MPTKNSNSFVKHYKENLTKDQIAKLRKLYPGYRQTMADERRDQYLANRRAMGNVTNTASAYGLGQGYIDRKRNEVYRNLDAYGRQLDANADALMENAAVTFANKTIDAKNEAAKKEYERKVKAANKKRAKQISDYNNALAEYEKAYQKYLNDLKEKDKAKRTSKRTQNTTDRAPVVKNYTSPTHVNPFAANLKETNYGRNTMYTDTGTGNNSYGQSYYAQQRAASVRKALALAGYKKVNNAAGKKKNRTGVNSGGGNLYATAQTDTGTGKTAANTIGKPTKPVLGITTEPLILPPEETAHIQNTVQQVAVQPPEQQEQFKNETYNAYLGDVAAYTKATDRMNAIQAEGQQAMAIMNRASELDSMMRDPRYSAEQRRGFSQEYSQLQRQYAVVAQSYKSHTQEYSQLQRYTQAQFPKLTYTRGVLGGLGMNVSEEDVLANASWIRGGGKVLTGDMQKKIATVAQNQTNESRDFWKYAKATTSHVEAAVTGSAAPGAPEEVAANPEYAVWKFSPDASKWFDSHGYMDFIESLTANYPPAEYGTLANAVSAYIQDNGLDQYGDYLSFSEQREYAKTHSLAFGRNNMGGYYLDEETHQKNRSVLWDALNKGGALEGLFEGEGWLPKISRATETNKSEALVEAYSKTYDQANRDMQDGNFNSDAVVDSMTWDRAIELLEAGEATKARALILDLLGSYQDELARKRLSGMGTVGKYAEIAISNFEKSLNKTGHWQPFKKNASAKTAAEATESAFTQDVIKRWMAKGKTDKEKERWGKAAEVFASAVASTFDNMPARLLGMIPGIGEFASKAEFFLSAAGGAQNEALRKGKGAGAATLYSMVIGASEVFLESLLGGIPLGKGSTMTTALKKFSENLPKAWLRTLAEIGVDAFGEFTEESLQEILDPVWNNLILGEHNEVKPFTWQTLSAGLSGAVSAVLGGSAHTLSTVASRSYSQAQLKKLGFSASDAEFYLQTKEKIANGSEVNDRDMWTYLTMQSGIIEAEKNGSSAILDFGRSAETDEEGRVKKKQSRQFNIRKGLGEVYDNRKAASETFDTTDHTEEYAKIKGTEEEALARVRNKPTGKIGDLYYATTDGKELDVSNMTLKQKIQYNMARKMAKAFPNVKIVLHDTFGDAAGRHVYADGHTIHLSLNSKNALSLVGAHELVHALQKTLGKNEYKSQIQSYLRGSFSDAITDTVRQEVIDNYKLDPRVMDEEAPTFENDEERKKYERDKATYEDELDAYLGEKLFTDDSFLDKIIRDNDPKNQKARAKVLNKLRDLVQRIQRGFKGDNVSADKQLNALKNRLTAAFGRDLSGSLDSASENAYNDTANNAKEDTANGREEAGTEVRAEGDGQQVRSELGEGVPPKQGTDTSNESEGRFGQEDKELSGRDLSPQEAEAAQLEHEASQGYTLTPEQEAIVAAYGSNGYMRDYIGKSDYEIARETGHLRDLLGDEEYEQRYGEGRFRKEESEPVKVSAQLNNAYEESGKAATELYDYSTDTAAFSDALQAAKDADPEHGWAVTWQSPEDLEGKLCLMDKDKTIGCVVTSDGDIEGVFKNKDLNHTKYALDGIMPQAIAHGGNKLDCFGPDLNYHYEDYGFVPVCRVLFDADYARENIPGWDESKGTPDIYFLAHNGVSATDVVKYMGKFSHASEAELAALPLMEYDEAAKYRDEILSKSVDYMKAATRLAELQALKDMGEELVGRDALQYVDLLDKLADMIRERANERGYTSPLLMHGTQRGGFTAIDVMKSDDHKSFFATESEETASTYTKRGQGKRNALSRPKKGGLSYDYEMRIDRAKQEVLSLWDDLVAYVNDTVDDEHFMNYIVPSSLEKAITEAYQGVADSWEDFATAMEAIKRSFTKEVFRLEYYEEAGDYTLDDAYKEWMGDDDYDAIVGVFDDYVSSITDAVDKLSNTIYDTAGSKKNTIYSLYANPNGLFTVDAKNAHWNQIPVGDKADFVSKRVLSFAVSEYKQYLAQITMGKPTPDWFSVDDSTLLLDYKTGEVEVGSSALAELDGYGDVLGAYRDAYGKELDMSEFPVSALTVLLGDVAENMLEKAPGESTRYMSTRELTDWAEANGYSGIKVENLIDNGGGGGKSISPATVYAFLAPAYQLKSADPVTYDDEGNIVPYLDRFRVQRGGKTEAEKTEAVDKNTELRWRKENFEESDTPIAASVDTKAVRQATKNGSSTTRDGYNIRVNYDPNGADYTVTVSKDGREYTREGVVAPELKGADVERNAASLLRNVMAGRPNSRNTNTSDIYIEKGEAPKRDVNVPRYDKNGRRVERFMRTIAEGLESEEMANTVIDSAIEGAASYDVIHNKAAMAYADRVVEDDITEAHKRWEEATRKNKIPTPHDIALGSKLLHEAANAGNVQDTLDLAVELSHALRRSGQAVQAARLLKRMGAAGTLYYVTRAIAKINRDLEATAKNYRVTINKELVNALLHAQNEAEIDAARDAILDDIAAQLKPTLSGSLNAWRYLAMLGNLRTHIRNIFGNAFFMPAVAVKNLIATGIEAFRKPENRTKALFYGKQYAEFAKWDWKTNTRDAIRNDGNKYEDVYGITSEIEHRRRKFPKWMKPVETLAKWNSKALESEDMIFKQAYYRTALASYLAAQKVNVNALRDALRAQETTEFEKDSAEAKLIETFEKAREYAINEANRNTYNDVNAFAQALGKLSRDWKNSDSLMAKGGHLLLEGMVPFKNTPANIVTRALEYGPAGIIKTLTQNAMDLKRGKIDGAQFIDNLAQGLTGTAIMALGVLLGRLGLLTGGFGTDKDDKDKKRKGHQSYAIEIGNFSYTLDWLAPESIPLFTGVELNRLWEQGGGDGETLWKAIGNAMTSMLEPIVNMSMLEGVQNTFTTIKYSDNELGDLAIALGSSYLSQFVPTLLGQVARSADKYTRRTYTDKNSPLPKLVDKFWQNIVKKIPTIKIAGKTIVPGNQVLEPYVNEWGEKEQENSLLLRIFENVFSPGYISTIKETAPDSIIAEVMGSTELSDEMRNGLYPTTAKQYFTYDGETFNLTAPEYTQYAEARGTVAGAVVTSFGDSKYFAGLSDVEKATAISEAFTYANTLAKSVILDQRLGENAPSIAGLSKWVGMANEYAESISDSPTAIADFIAIRTHISGMSKDGGVVFGDLADYTTTNKNGEKSVKWADMKWDYLRSLNLSDNERLFLADAFGVQTDAYEKAQSVTQSVNLDMSDYEAALAKYKELTKEQYQKKEQLSEAEYEAWMAENKSRYKDYLNDNAKLNGEQKLKILTEIGDSEGWETKYNETAKQAGISADATWNALYAYSNMKSDPNDSGAKTRQLIQYLSKQTGLNGKQKVVLYGMTASKDKATAIIKSCDSMGVDYGKVWDCINNYATSKATDDASKADQLRAYVGKKNFTGKQRFAVYDLVAGEKTLETLDSDFKKKWAAFDASGIKYEAYWDYKQTYDSGTRGADFHAMLDKSNLSGAQKFAMLEYTCSSSAWIEKAADCKKAGIPYDTCWKIARKYETLSKKAGNYTGTKKSYISSYARQLGLSSSQINKLLDIWKWS